ncbi:unnamed protein product [Rhodiola kirilowii]
MAPKKPTPFEQQPRADSSSDDEENVSNEEDEEEESEKKSRRNQIRSLIPRLKRRMDLTPELMKKLLL